MYDILEKEYTTALLLKYDDDGQEQIKKLIFGQMAELGYDSSNGFTLLGTCGILITLHFMMMIVYLFILCPIHYMKPDNENFNWFMKALRPKLFFQDILSVVLGTYIDILISICLNYSHPLKTTVGEIFSYYFMIYVSVWTFIIVPILLILLIWFVKKDFEAEKF